MYSIYKIEHKTKPELVYVGSTKDFNHRKHVHKYNCRTSNAKVYQMIREYGWDQFEMIELNRIECIPLEARQEEERCRIELNARLNTRGAVLDTEKQKQYKQQYNQQYNQEHHEEIKQHKQQYREIHRDEIKQKQKEPYTCPCGSQITRTCKSRHLRSKKHITWTQKPRV